MSEHGATAQVSLTRRRAVGLAAAMGISAATAAMAAQAGVVLADGASDAATLTDLPLVEFGSYPQGPAAEVLPIE